MRLSLLLFLVPSLLLAMDAPTPYTPAQPSLYLMSTDHTRKKLAPEIIAYSPQLSEELTAAATSSPTQPVNVRTELNQRELEDFVWLLTQRHEHTQHEKETDAPSILRRLGQNIDTIKQITEQRGNIWAADHLAALLKLAAEHKFPLLTKAIATKLADDFVYVPQDVITQRWRLPLKSAGLTALVLGPHAFLVPQERVDTQSEYVRAAVQFAKPDQEHMVPLDSVLPPCQQSYTCVRAIKQLLAQQHELREQKASPGQMIQELAKELPEQDLTSQILVTADYLRLKTVAHACARRMTTTTSTEELINVLNLMPFDCHRYFVNYVDAPTTDDEFIWYLKQIIRARSEDDLLIPEAAARKIISDYATPDGRLRSLLRHPEFIALAEHPVSCCANAYYFESYFDNNDLFMNRCDKRELLFFTHRDYQEESLGADFIVGHANKQLLANRTEDKPFCPVLYDCTGDIYRSKLFKGHTDRVTCLETLTPTTFASGSRDGTVRIWETKSGTCTTTLTLGKPLVGVHGLKPHLLACASTQELVLYDLTNQNIIQRRRFIDGVKILKMKPITDHTMFCIIKHADIQQHGCIFINMQTGTITKPFSDQVAACVRDAVPLGNGHLACYMDTLRLSPQENRFNNVGIIDAAGNLLRTNFYVEGGYRSAVARGKYFIALDPAGEYIRVINMQTGTRWSFRYIYNGYHRGSVALLSDGKLAIHDGHILRIWNVPHFASHID